ncbi:uncharacterized protein LOC125493472 [Beta vulgaris subsp. vulgaris]|uniref:uncharacterized protein LOC125493472 n=1 Tax=Beta vulgaris subsp. vulgaris TaxID=3555 RepID=UPI0020369092|nr:uncharacterized protein LOC125493472 [Beta vulgaris subsp. vulgaris]
MLLRHLLVMSLLEEARTWCMKKVGERFDKALKIGADQLTPYAAKILEERGRESRFCQVINAGGGEFEVRDGNVKFPICLRTRTYACGKWQGSGMPCKHVLRVIFHQRLEPLDFVSSYFKGAAYKLTYSAHIHPMSDPIQWPSFDLPTILPPPIKRAAGIPPKLRRR